jgi:hypothetical protein
MDNAPHSSICQARKASKSPAARRADALPETMPRVFRFAIDRGGTFTDVYAEMDVLGPDGRVESVSPCVIKLLSEDPANYPDAPR